MEVVVVEAGVAVEVRTHEACPRPSTVTRVGMGMQETRSLMNWFACSSSRTLQRCAAHDSARCLLPQVLVLQRDLTKRLGWQVCQPEDLLTARCC